MVKNLIFIPGFFVHGVIVSIVGFNIPSWQAWALIFSGAFLYVIGILQGRIES